MSELIKEKLYKILDTVEVKTLQKSNFYKEVMEVYNQKHRKIFNVSYLETLFKTYEENNVKAKDERIFFLALIGHKFVSPPIRLETVIDPYDKEVIQLQNDFLNSVVEFGKLMQKYNFPKDVVRDVGALVFSLKLGAKTEDDFLLRDLTLSIYGGTKEEFEFINRKMYDSKDDKTTSTDYIKVMAAEYQRILDIGKDVFKNDKYRGLYNRNIKRNMKAMLDKFRKGWYH